jgi:hypothetical protein
MYLARIRLGLVAVLCMLIPLFFAAQGFAQNQPATYISFEVAGALGTYPMSINNSMTVTGYYYVSSTVTNGFLRTADGVITTFAIPGSVWTEPRVLTLPGISPDITRLSPGFRTASCGTRMGA